MKVYGLRFAIISVLILVFSLPNVIFAHGGGTPQLVNAEIGPYRVSVWTQPEPLKVGEAHFTVALSEPSATSDETGPPVLGAAIELRFSPLNGRGESFTVAATHEAAVNKLFYEADFELPDDGRWRVEIVVAGPTGSGETAFEIDVLPAPANSSRILWVGAGLIGLVFIGARKKVVGGKGAAILSAVILPATIGVYGLAQPAPAIAEASPLNVTYWQNLVVRPEPLAVTVTASQWEWRFAYPETGIETETLVLPLGRPAQLNLVSADVVHSFAVADFDVEQAIVPGVAIDLQLTPTRTGTYALECSAVCGLGAAEMSAQVQVVSVAEFDRWIQTSIIDK